MITQRIENTLEIEIENADLEEASNIEFYVRQGEQFFMYKPTVIDKTHMRVTIPKDDAMSLLGLTVSLQTAFTDSSGNPRSSEIARYTVGEFLKEAGYGD